MIRKTCRMCKSENLFQFLDFGTTALADNFLTLSQLNHSEPKFPLNVNMCKKCGLFQLGYVVPPESMFNENYPYESSITKTGRKHFLDMSTEICRRFNFPKNSLTIDVGSNVGVLLSGFKSQGLRVVGIEPSSSIAQIAVNNDIETIIDFYSSNLSLKIREKKGKASIITATNVFAHIDNLYDFAAACNNLLTEDGILVIEAPYLPNLLDNLEYDTIYHEHLSYLSLKPMIRFFKDKGMEVFDVELYPIHGGSMRYYIGREGKYPISKKISEFLSFEEKKQIYSIHRINQFSNDVQNHREQLTRILKDFKKNGKRIIAISAPAKGNTLLSYCNIGPETIDYITEKSAFKIGKYTPGTHIPIYSDEMLHSDNPDYALILAWNFADEIIRNISKLQKSGIKFIIPIPNPYIV